VKRKLAMILALLGTAIVLSPQPAFAQGSITLTNGAVQAGVDFYSQAFFDFWRGLTLELTGDDPVYRGSAAGSGRSYDRGDLTEVTTSGQVTATYDRETELLRGDYLVTEQWVYHRETAAGVEHMETTMVYEGRFRADLLPTDTEVKIDFEGSMSTEITGDIPPGWWEDPNFSTSQTMDWDFAVVFEVDFSGVPESTSTETSGGLRPVPDSGARFSGLGGEVAVNIPVGIDTDGNYVYEAEPTDPSSWNFAKYDTVLPAGTMIHTGEDSSMILSFADMTTFQAKPDTIIILSDPTQQDSQMKLLVGNLWVNLKKMVTTGQMDLEMGQAVAGIKGTTLVLSEDGTTSALKVIEGTVEFTALADGTVQMVSAGEAITADADGLGEITTFDVAAEAAAWAALAPDATTTATPAPAGTTDTRSSNTAVLLLAAGGVVLLAVGAVLVSRRRVHPPTTA
jgi:hypothetical protein